MRRAIGGILVLAFVIGCGMRSARAEETSGTLEKVEQKLETPKPDDHHHHHDSTTDALADSFFQALLFSLFSQPAPSSWVSGDLESYVPWGDWHRDLRKEWSPALPTVQFHGAYQNLAGDTQGYRLHLTGGFLLFGADLDWVHYFESTPATRLKIISPHVLIRLLPTKFWQLDVALGAKVIDGRRTHAGFEFGIPNYFWFGRHVVWDIRPYASEIYGTKIWDVGSGLAFKWKFAGARAGYRLIDIGGESLHGPEVGVVIQW